MAVSLTIVTLPAMANSEDRARQKPKTRPAGADAVIVVCKVCVCVCFCGCELCVRGCVWVQRYLRFHSRGGGDVSIMTASADVIDFILIEKV